LIADLWIGFYLLEGFDFGVGMLLPFLGKKDEERLAIRNTVGSVWDGSPLGFAKSYTHSKLILAPPS